MTGEADDRPDLAAMLVRLGRRMVAVEQPILTSHDISMWGYAVLTALRDEPMRTQSALARSIGADKTRLIAVLDELQQRDLIEREPDPADRRVHLLRLTPAGRTLHSEAQSAIRSAEATVLDQLPPPDRDTFLRALQALAAGTTR
ncbi:MarR family winged helix-turn-helix transcriptional regulator [Paractinoplanes maris]|uniref:MarR family winged helix-turn-helix transcriptional regulator n=1 Tax=Paractinoplanes maris TaxID=1734446 RepID=UPI0020226182|nr:MarR family transcriptional regulator [Actinoplanes maris]